MRLASLFCFAMLFVAFLASGCLFVEETDTPAFSHEVYSIDIIENMTVKSNGVIEVYKPPQDYVYWVINIGFTSIANKTVKMMDTEIATEKEVYDLGNMVDFSKYPILKDHCIPLDIPIILEPGEEKSGCLVFMLPRDDPGIMEKIYALSLTTIEYEESAITSMSTLVYNYN